MTNAVPPFTNLLVHVNPRLEQGPAASCAATLAQKWQAALTLFDVTTDLSWPLQYLVGGWEEMVEQVSGSKRKALTDLTQRLCDEGVDATAELGDGRLATAISERALAADHDLVVKVAEGDGPDRSGFLGSTDQRLLRECPCALLILNPSGGAHFERVAAALDAMDDHAIQVQLDEAVLSASRDFCSGELHLLYAMPPLQKIIEVEKVDADLVDKEQLATWDADLRRAAHDKLQALSDDPRFAPATPHVLTGNPEEAIPRFTKDHQIDLLVMGTLGRSGLDGVLIGNTAERLLANLDCSVLALKPHQFSSLALNEQAPDVSGSD